MQYPASPMPLPPPAQCVSLAAAAAPWFPRAAELQAPRALSGSDGPQLHQESPDFESGGFYEVASARRAAHAGAQRDVAETLTRWNGPPIAEALGDVDVQYVWHSLRKQKIDLGGRKSWCESKDPAFAAKPPMRSAFTWRHLKTRSFTVSRRSPQSRRVNAPKATPARVSCLAVHGRCGRSLVGLYDPRQPDCPHAGA